MKHKRPKIKVLPVGRYEQFWLTGSLINPRMMEPILNRPGFYLRGNKCWVEIESVAFEASPNLFKFDLEVFESEKITEAQYKALLEIRKQKLATKGQLRLIVMYEHLRDIRYKKDRAMLKKLRATKERNANRT